MATAVSGWVAEDGTFFEDEAACRVYEETKRWTKFKSRVEGRLKLIGEDPDRATVVEVAGYVKVLCERVMA